MSTQDTILDAIDDAAKKCAEWDVEEVDEYEAPVERPLHLDGHYETFRDAVDPHSEAAREGRISHREVAIDAPRRYEGQVLRGNARDEAGPFFCARYEYHCEQM